MTHSRRTRRSASGHAPCRLVLALALAGAASHVLLPGLARAQALPTGLNVTQGTAAVNLAGRQMTVNNSAGAVLQWQNFSIGAGNSVRFEQPSASSRVLNQVVGANPSNIFGSLSSNGEVWLVNPYGVLFGRDARVDVASLVVSTLGISADDWRHKRLGLTAGSDTLGAVVNQGALRSAAGGRVLLLAGAGGVRNEGLIEAPDGQVVLAAGRSIELTDSGARNVAVQVQAPQGEALNLGSLSVGGGRVDLWAAMVNQQGVVRADGLGAGGGEIVARASEGLQTGAGSITSASGSSGGQLVLDAGAGTARLAGSLQATAASGTGGDIRLLGRQVGLLEGVAVDASGAAGGGVVRIGGGRHGLDASVPNAEAVYMSATASVRADAGARGDGGSIVLWSDKATRAYGRLSARGGAEGGNGGFIETSGGWLDARPASVRTDAPRGRAGTWLLDPNNIFIIDGGNDANITGNPDFSTTDDSAVLTTGSIVSALNAGNNVTVTTASLGGNAQAGDIVMFAANLSVATTPDVSLTLNAARNISLQSSTIESQSIGKLSLVLNAATGGQGSINIDNTRITTQGGDVTLGGAATAVGTHGTSPFAGALGYDGNGIGVSVSRSSIDAGSGDIVMRGASLAQSGVAGLAQGVSINNGSSLQARRIDLRGWVDSDSSLNRIGTVVETGTALSATEAVVLRGDVASAFDASFFRPLEGVRVAGTVAVLNSTPAVGSTLDIAGAVNEAVLTQSDAMGMRLAASGSIDASGALTASIAGAHGVTLGDFNQFAFVTASSGGQTSISSTGTLSRIDVNNLQISGAPSLLRLQADTVAGFAFVSLSGSAAITISAGSYQPQFGGSLSAPGVISILADNVNLPASFSASSQASGDAIVVAGRAANTNTQSFLNSAGSGVFDTPAGRWLLYATDPGNSSNFNLGGLDYDATVYGTVPGQVFDAGTHTSTGRLLLFSVAPSLAAGTGSAIARTYDGTRDVDVTDSGAVTGLVNGDRLFGLFDTKDVGSNKPIELFPATNPPSLFDSNGKPVFGYAVPSSFALTGNVDPRPLALVGVTAGNKVYDGNTSATVGDGSLSGLVFGETLGLALGPGQFADKNVGDGKAVSGSFTLSDGTGLVSNYSLASNLYSSSANITARTVTVTGVTAANKVYDGNTTATLAGGSLSNLVSGETLLLTTSGASFADQNVGTGKTVTGTASLADGSGLASNYQLAGSGAFTVSADITARPLTVSGVAAASKPYDGGLAATLSGGVLANLVAGETLTLNLSGGQFASKDVGIGKAVTGSAALADGSGLASNYSLANSTVSASADITPRSVTASGITAAGKVYDGSTAATLAGGTLSGLVAGETLTLLSSGQFVTKDAGTGKTVDGTAALADGTGLASNYSLTGAAFSTSADITPRSLSLGGLSVAGKTYDGTRTAAVAGGTLAGLVTGETLQFAATALFDTANAGTGKTVSGSVSLQDGTGLASNYSLAGGGTFSASADIARRTLTLSGVTAAGKVYDGTTAVTLSGGTLAGLVGSETLGLNLSGALVDKNAGLGKAVTGTATLADGSGLAANYQLAAGGFSTGADVARRGLTVASATVAGKVYDGSTAATVSAWTLAGVLGADQVSVTAGSAAFSSAGVAAARSATATASSLGGSDAANYLLAQPTVASAAAITPATLTYLATPAVSPLGSLPASFGGSVTGFVAGETLAGATTGSLLFSTTATTASPVGSYAIDGSGLAAANYVFVQAAGNASALTIVPGFSTPPGGPVAVEPLQPEPIRTSAVLPSFNLGPGWSGRTVDVMQAATVDPASGTTTFGPINLDDIQQDTLAALLEARSRYKRSVLDAARRRLEEDPALADVPPCESLQQIETGKCLVTDEQLAQAQAGGAPAGVVLVQPVAPVPAPAAPPVAAAPPVPSSAPAPASTPPVAAATSSLVIPLARPPAQPTTQAPPLPVVRPVRTASLPQIQRKLAVLIGEDNYADDRIPQLENARRDATAVAAVLADKLGYDTVVVRDGSREAIVGVLNKLALTAQPADSVLIYYAGHGYVVDKTSNGYWIPSSADAERPETWISNNDIDKLVGRIRAQQVVLVSDSCYSGSLIGDQRVLRAGEQVTDARTILGRRAAVVMSSGGNEPVADGARNGHSPFALSLMQNMEAVPEWRIGTQLFENVRADVARRLPQRPQYGTSRLGRHSLGADYLFESRQLDAPAP